MEYGNAFTISPLVSIQFHISVLVLHNSLSGSMTIY